MWRLTALFIATALLGFCGARRYRTCEEGCCVHEYCAYHRICYPRIHCSLGCPDGQCVGQDQQQSGSVSQSDVFRQRLVFSSNENKHNLEMSRESPALSERYSYQDNPYRERSSSNKENSQNSDKNTAKNEDFLSSNTDNSYAPRLTAKSPVEVTNGICMPYQPCVEGEYCGLGHSCTFNYNLGYHVCQYNLDIGSTLCYDSKGRPALKSLS